MAGSKEFDISDRASRFGESIIDFALAVRTNAVTKPLISQVTRSGTSIGANLCEADESGTTKEFLYRISLACRETKETQHWLRMLARADRLSADHGRRLWKEADEIKRVLSAISRNTKRNAASKQSRK